MNTDDLNYRSICLHSLHSTFIEYGHFEKDYYELRPQKSVDLSVETIAAVSPLVKDMIAESDDRLMLTVNSILSSLQILEDDVILMLQNYVYSDYEFKTVSVRTLVSRKDVSKVVIKKAKDATLNIGSLLAADKLGNEKFINEWCYQLLRQRCDNITGLEKSVTSLPHCIEMTIKQNAIATRIYRAKMYQLLFLDSFKFSVDRFRQLRFLWQDGFNYNLMFTGVDKVRPMRLTQEICNFLHEKGFRRFVPKDYFPVIVLRILQDENIDDYDQFLLSLNYMREYNLLNEKGIVYNQRGFEMDARQILLAEHLLVDSWLKSTVHSMMNGKHVRHYKRQLELVIKMMRSFGFEHN